MHNIKAPSSTAERDDDMHCKKIKIGQGLNNKVFDEVTKHQRTGVMAIDWTRLERHSVRPSHKSSKYRHKDHRLQGPNAKFDQRSMN